MLCNAKCYITFEIKVINRGLLIEASRKVHQKDDTFHSRDWRKQTK